MLRLHAIASPFRSRIFIGATRSPAAVSVLRVCAGNTTGAGGAAANATIGAVHIWSRHISIPVDRIDFNFARSSGPGGQNVNKVNTKAELRFHVMDADWIPDDVKHRLVHLQRHRINNEGELVLTSQEARTQVRNRELVLSKLKEALAEAEVEPKERHIWAGIGDRGRAERRAEKTHRKDVKSNRGRSNNHDFD